MSYFYFVKIGVVILFIFTSYASFAQLRLPPERKALYEAGLYPEEKLQGKVKKVVTINYRMKKDSVSGKLMPSDIDFETGKIYDMGLNLVSESWRLQQGRTKEFTHHYYDDDGRLILSLNLETKKAMDSIAYNDSQRKIFRLRQLPAGPEKKVYYFDEQGLLIKEEIYNLKDSLPAWVFRYEYDNKNRLIREDKENTGNIGITVTFNNETSTSIFPGSSFVYVYNDQDGYSSNRKFERLKDTLKLKEETIEYKTGFPRIFRTYKSGTFANPRTDSLVIDKNGYVLFRIFDESSYVKLQETHFDKWYRPLSIVGHSATGYRQHYEYEFDKEGNWTEERMYNKDTELINLRKRIIEYFR